MNKGYLYALESSTGVIKIGMSKQPGTSRVQQHITLLEQWGLTVLGAYVSPVIDDVDEREREALQWARQIVNRTRSRGEYFRGLNFETVREYIMKLTDDNRSTFQTDLEVEGYTYTFDHNNLVSHLNCEVYMRGGIAHIRDLEDSCAFTERLMVRTVLRNRPDVFQVDWDTLQVKLVDVRAKQAATVSAAFEESRRLSEIREAKKLAA